MVRYVIADDAPFIHEIIKNVLPDAHYLFQGSAYSGPETLEIVARTLPDVLFLDFVMPGRSGLEILPELKLIWPELKIIGVSTLDNQNVIAAAQKSGVDYFMAKPFNKDELLNSLAAVGKGAGDLSHKSYPA